MNPWDHDDMSAASRAAWDDDDHAGGVEHCRRMIGLEQLTPGSAVADFGCGVGRLLIPHARRFPGTMFYGIDTSDTMRRHARAVAKQEQVSNVEVIAVWPETSAWCDVVYSVVVVQHLKPHVLTNTLVAARRALKDGGRLRVQFVEEGDEGPLNHPCSKFDMRRAMAWAGFIAVEFESDPVFPTWTWCTAR